MSNMSFLRENRIKMIRLATFAFALLAVFFVAHGASAAPVYYSVGQTTSNLMTGAPTVTIASGTATFSVAQTGNIGVGDRVTYNTSDIAYISGKTSTSVWTLVTKTGSIPTDITTSVVVSITREYTSLAAAEAGATDANHLNTTDLVAGNYQLNFPCYYDTGADTAAVVVLGYTTSASNFIKIYTPNNTSTEANNSQRHSGKWDDGKYSIYRSSGILIDIRVSHIAVDGIQFKGNGSGGYNHSGVYSDVISGDLSGNITVKNGIFQGLRNAIGSYRLNGAAKIYYHNNIIYNGENSYGGIYFKSEGDNASFWAYNNTVYDCGIGLQQSGTARVYAKNNLIHSCTVAASGTFQAGTDYNATDDALMNYTVTGGGNTHDKLSQAIQFADLANNDSHLSPSDTSAKNAGVDLSADANLAFTTDIDGQTRPSSSSTTWDIGADEAATAIYYSVGQNTTSHETGAGTVTVDATNKTATFSVAQTATNMGVGDLVTYAGGSCYITSKTSTSVWGCQSATGGAPTAATNADVTSITHAYASLSAAEAGAIDATHLNTTDLVTGNYQLNFPCYYDTGADTTAVTVSGYTTGVSNYIKIYTPNNTTTEANNSQRHQGKWDDGKYVLEKNINIVLNINNEHVRVDGLQFHNTDPDDWGISIYAATTSAADIKISNNIIKHENPTGTNNKGVDIRGASGSVVYVWNNIIFNLGVNGHAVDMVDSDPIYYLYNNTLVDNGYGLYRSGGTVIAKNNIVKGSGNTNAYVGTFASGTDYNATDGTDAIGQGSNNKISQTFSFADAANKDFHLKSTDTAAKGAGLDLQRDSYFAFDTDIDGQVRVNPWDIGADQFKDTVIQTQQSSPNLDAGLVGHWTFDGEDVSKTTAKDVSGNNNNGTITGATVTPGKLGQGMKFDSASNQYISTTSGFSYAFTFAAWVNISSTPPSLYSIIGPSSDSRPLFGIFSDRRLILQSSGATTIGYSSSAIPLNTWTHVAVAYNMISGDYAFYINGDLSGSGNFTQFLTLTPSLLIGCRYNTELFFNGKMDEVRVYNRRLSENEVGQLYRQGEVTMQTSQNEKNTDGLVGLWSFDGPDVSGTTAYDRSGLGNNGTISGATVVPGKLGQGMKFDGVNDYVNVPYDAALELPDSGGSISLWMNVNPSVTLGQDVSMGIFRKAIHDNWEASGGYMLGLYQFGPSSAHVLQARIGAINDDELFLGVNNVSNDVWHHVVLEWNTSEVNMYLDGVLEKNAVRTKILSYSVHTEPLRIGHLGMGTNKMYFNGKIDDVHIYNRALSESEISNLYNTGKVEIRR